MEMELEGSWKSLRLKGDPSKHFPTSRAAFSFLLASPWHTFNWIFQFKLKLIFTLSISIYQAIYIPAFWTGLSLPRVTHRPKIYKKRNEREKINNVGKTRGRICFDELELMENSSKAQLYRFVARRKGTPYWVN